MRPVDFQQVKQLVSLAQVLDWLGWLPRRRERAGLHGRCPLHSRPDSRGDTFSVRGNEWYCHKCCKGGAQIELYALLYGLKPLAAAVEMCQRAGVDVPYLPRRPRKPRQPRNRKEAL